MSRLSLILAIVVAVLLAAFLPSNQARVDRDAAQRTLDQMDSDAAAAKAAASAAAESASQAMDAARKARNALPRSS
jgi:hypothetical protein